MPLGSKVAVWNSRAVLEAARGSPTSARGVVQFRARESIEAVISSTRNQDHAVGQQGRRVESACGVEAACETPGPARRIVAVRQSRNRHRSQKKRVRDRALLSGGSLPEREWDHANRQQQKQIKGASKKMRFDVWISLFFYFDLILCHLVCFKSPGAPFCLVCSAVG